MHQDDLDDCGEVSASVKFRLMPKCWFALYRCRDRQHMLSMTSRPIYDNCYGQQVFSSH